ncbi:hypothetical protein SAMN06298216_4277 [Spirosomataceae bacterium TFI 002]|nr:hypothetical protein SAMN06298216_4277 [Spirosomataceae bacterium TFI 002]
MKYLLYYVKKLVVVKRTRSYYNTEWQFIYQLGLITYHSAFV